MGQQKVLTNTVDDERKEITKELKKKYSNDNETLEIIKNTMWPLRHHFDDISKKQQEKLDCLAL